jgi:hypothetical protein
LEQWEEVSKVAADEEAAERQFSCEGRCCMGHNFIANCVDQPLECIGTAIVDNSFSQSHAQQHFRLTLQQYLSLAAEIIVAVLEGEM